MDSTPLTLDNHSQSDKGPLMFYQNGGAANNKLGSGVTSSSSLGAKSTNSKSSSRKISQMDVLRMKKFQDFLNDSSP